MALELYTNVPFILMGYMMLPMIVGLLISLLVTLMFLFVGISYKNDKYDPGSRHLTGIFLAIVSGMWALENLYNVLSREFLHDFSAMNVLAIIGMLFVPVSMLLMGIALAGGKFRRIRTAALWLLTGAAVYTLFIFYYRVSGLLSAQFFNGSVSMITGNILSVLYLAFPAAIFNWALALYNKPEIVETKKEIRNNDLLDN